MNQKDYTQFIETRTAPHSRWSPQDKSFFRPHVCISEPLEQCHFVMTQLDNEKNIIPVDMWGNQVDPFNLLDRMVFRTTRALWADDYGQTFDGYAVVLDEKPLPVTVKGKEYWLVAGLHRNCVIVTGQNIDFSKEFLSAIYSLNEPLYGVCPNKRDAYWLGLSSEPIVGGNNGSAIISSYNQMIPIALESGDKVLHLPIDAEKIIHNILGG